MTAFNIVQALNDPKVFARYFRSESWNAWRVFLAALFSLPLTRDQLALFRQFTGRGTPPTKPLQEAWLICGRRAGKSYILSVIATYLACFRTGVPISVPARSAPS
jgi:hypothetical protein